MSDNKDAHYDAMMRRAEAEERRMRALELAIECAQLFGQNTEDEVLGTAKHFHKWIVGKSAE